LDGRRRAAELRVALLLARADVHPGTGASAVAFNRRRELSSHLRRWRHHGKLFDQLCCAGGAGVGVHLDQALDDFPQRRRHVRGDVFQ